MQSSLGAYIRQKRVEAGISLREAARRLNLSAVYLGEVERGVRPTMASDRLQELEHIIKGFSALEAMRLMSASSPVKMDLSEAPAQYRDLGLALARRIERQDLAPKDLDELLKILSGGAR